MLWSNCLIKHISNQTLTKNPTFRCAQSKVEMYATVKLVPRHSEVTFPIMQWDIAVAFPLCQKAQDSSTAAHVSPYTGLFTVHELKSPVSGTRHTPASDLTHRPQVVLQCCTAPSGSITVPLPIMPSTLWCNSLIVVTCDKSTRIFAQVSLLQNLCKSLDTSFISALHKCFISFCFFYLWGIRMLLS